MTVYVDDMQQQVGRLTMCHMIADTQFELHHMAEWIGVAPKWHQGDHYDIGRMARHRAVKAGAREITQRTAAAMMFVFRREGWMPIPHAAALARHQLLEFII
jgi:hypothetical protein